MATPRTTSSKRDRERDLVLATRALFDERGRGDAPIEEIARAVGIARGLIYRHFSSKEELFVLTVTDYLDELALKLEQAIALDDEPREQLIRCTEAYARFCELYPAFLDCSLSLMHRPAHDLHDMVSESVWLRLGQDMARCIGQLSAVLAAGAEQGVFTVEDPDYTANALWTQGLGLMHLARIRVGVRSLGPGVPGLFAVDPDDVIRTCVTAALGTVGAAA
jgi:AcrR family transcriptional regulator